MWKFDKATLGLIDQAIYYNFKLEFNEEAEWK